MPTKVVIAEHLDMSERNAHDVLNLLTEKHGLERNWWQSAALADIRMKYIRDLREKAAGRGGDDQANLTKNRAEESAVKTAMLRLEYQEKIGALVPADAAGSVIVEWCVLANREYMSGLDKLVGEIQSVFKIKVDKKLVEKIAGSTLKRIQGHASSIGEALVESSEGVHSTEDTANG